MGKCLKNHAKKQNKNKVLSVTDKKNTQNKTVVQLFFMANFYRVTGCRAANMFSLFLFPFK
jgi:hypothetical protein